MPPAIAQGEKLTIFECPTNNMTPENINQQAEISLPFNPREHYFSSDESVFVEDAFAAGAPSSCKQTIWTGPPIPRSTRPFARP